MRNEDTIANILERQESWFLDTITSTQDDQAPCCICSELHSPESEVWRIPHDCALHMPDEEAYVCCKSCEKQWLEKHWEEIEEYEQLKMV